MNVIPSSIEAASYALLTAAYNEEHYIEETIKSVVAQVVQPKAWVIVSDGSTDRTDDIVRQYATRHPFIRLIRREKDHCREFASKVFALRAGFQTLAPESIRFIGHLDADVRLDPLYFRDLLAKFGEDPELGVAGGCCFERTSCGVWRPRPGNCVWSVPGAMQMFRGECYKNIGEMPPIEYGGDDWYAEIRARMYGWRVRSFPELEVFHLRPSGTRTSLLRYCYRSGFMDFAVGSHPLFEIVKLAKMSSTPPYLLNALVRMAGFLVAHIYGSRMVSPAFVAFLQREQLGRLCAFFCWDSGNHAPLASGRERSAKTAHRDSCCLLMIATGIVSSVLTCSRAPVITSDGRNPSSDPVDAPHFLTQPATGVFADGGGGYTSAQCAAALDPNASSDIYNGHPISQETVPENQQPHSLSSPPDGITSPVNQTKPNATQLAYYASDGYLSSTMDAPYTWMKQVDGQYTGSTEMIIRWAACKWGMDEDMIRAQATAEHGTWIQWNAGGDERRSISQCQAGNNADHNSTDLWGYRISNACYQSWSMWQTKVVYSSPDAGAWTTWPAINESTAFAVDYRYGYQRSCMNGDRFGYFKGKGTGNSYLADVVKARTDPYSESPHKFWNPVTDKYATNLEYVEFACLGAHYSGRWMDSDPQSYLLTLLTQWKRKDWLPK